MSEPSSSERPANNLWLRGPLAENPYERTAFHTARIARETTRRGAIVQAVSQTRQLVAADPQAHTLGGRPVTPGEINKVEGILLDAPRRILEELLHHATERPPLGPLRAAAQQLTAFRPDGEENDADAVIQPPRLQFPAALAQLWAAHLAATFLAQAGGADAGFGARELEIVPPFHHPDQDS